jgi:hypothetical protein
MKNDPGFDWKPWGMSFRTMLIEDLAVVENIAVPGVGLGI